MVFSVPHFRARQEMKLSLVDLGIPINEVLDVVGDASPKLKRGQVNIVDVDIPLGMIFPAAKMALVSLSDTQGAMATRTTEPHRCHGDHRFPSSRATT